jgi:hypothetical protein
MNFYIQMICERADERVGMNSGSTRFSAESDQLEPI